jgi:hypothetical protein
MKEWSDDEHSVWVMLMYMDDEKIKPLNMEFEKDLRLHGEELLEAWVGERHYG